MSYDDSPEAMQRAGHIWFPADHNRIRWWVGEGRCTLVRPGLPAEAASGLGLDYDPFWACVGRLEHGQGARLFAEWVGCLGGELTRAVEEKGAINPDELAKTIGVTPATVISLALALHREGAIKITELKAEPSNGVNTEICGCLRQH